ncbi:hypothetical protein V8C86DRAFT_656772 [Haematococcus lacustris]
MALWPTPQCQLILVSLLHAALTLGPTQPLACRQQEGSEHSVPLHCMASRVTAQTALAQVVCGGPQASVEVAGREAACGLHPGHVLAWPAWPQPGQSQQVARNQQLLGCLLLSGACCLLLRAVGFRREGQVGGQGEVVGGQGVASAQAPHRSPKPRVALGQAAACHVHPPASCLPHSAAPGQLASLPAACCQLPAAASEPESLI